MIHINSFYLTSDVSVLNRNHITVALTITNTGSKTYYMSGDVGYSRGFHGHSFELSGPSNIPCSFHSGFRSAVDPIVLENSQSITSSNLLNDICNFAVALPGTYNISFDKTIMLYDSAEQENTTLYTHLSSSSTFDLPGVPIETIPGSLSSDDF